MGIAKTYETIVWYGALGVGMVLFLTGILFLLLKKKCKEEHFLKAACIEFVAEWVLIFPNVLFQEIPYTNDFLHITESLLVSFVQTFNMYLGNGYERFAYAEDMVLTGVYSILRILVYMALTAFVTGFVLTVVDGPMQRVRLRLNAGKKQFIFSACNEKSLSIAASIPRQKKENIIFIVQDNLDTRIKDRMKEMGAVYVKLSLENVVEKLNGKAKKMELFLFGENEKENLDRLNELGSKGFLEKGCQKKLYVELQDTPWSLYDNFMEKLKAGEKEQAIINFVRTEENFAYNNLLQYSIFQNAVDNTAEQCKDINVLIVGMNARNLELLKAILHLGQMPGYHLSIMVLDAEANRDVLRRKMPEIEDSCKVLGDAWYELRYRENVQFASCALESMVEKEFFDFTCAYVGAGEDLQNIDIAMRLNAMKYRTGQRDGYLIQVNVKQKEFCDHLNQDRMKHIVPSGMFSDLYRYDFITMAALERCAAAIHEVRNQERKKKNPEAEIKSWVSYCNNEYNRHSVYARTLSLKYKVELIDLYYGSDYSVISQQRVWKVYEHMRWNVYTRTMGYRLAQKQTLDALGRLDRDTRQIAMIHGDLVPFENLLKEEQDKDGIVLTERIVAELKKL